METKGYLEWVDGVKDAFSKGKTEDFARLDGEIRVETKGRFWASFSEGFLTAEIRLRARLRRGKQDEQNEQDDLNSVCNRAARVSKRE